MIGYIKEIAVNMPLRRKFFILTILISIIPVTGLGVFSYRVSQKYIKGSAIDNAIMKSEAVNSRLERYLSTIDDTSLMLISNNYFQKFLKEHNVSERYLFENEVKWLFSSILSSKNNVHSILLYDIEGNLRIFQTASAQNEEVFRGKISDNIQTNSVFEEVKELSGKRIWTKLFKDTDKISMIRVVNDIGTQKPIGTLIINLNEDHLQYAIQGLETINEGNFIVFEQNGNIIYSKGTKMYMPDFSDIPGDSSGYSIINLNGVKCLNVYYTSKYCGWKMVTLIPLNSLFLNLVSIKQVTVIIVIVCLFAVVIFSILVTNFLTKPIIKLRILMRKAEQGDLDIRFHNNYNDEIGQLGQNFNSMIENTKLLLKENNEKQKRLRVLELRALQAQINPHFLYNTIDTINWMAQSIDAEEISQVSTALANYYRLSLSKGADIIKIQDEVNQVKNYLTIQKIRYESHLNYEINISENILNLYICKLTLQPIVENAIYHGIKDKEEGGTIRILGWMENDRVVLEVHDNGKGMNSEKLIRVRESFNKIRVDGFGLSNVDERIKLYFGDQYGIFIESIEGVETIVRIVFPAMIE